jgi:hypothetical protein
MQSLPCGHYPSEQASQQTYDELQGFFAADAALSRQL